MTAFRARLDHETLPSSKRATARRKLRLNAPGLIAGDSEVLILDISTTGLLIETTAGNLKVGDTIGLDLLEAPGVRAVVKWSSGEFFGCQFTQPVSVAIVSAALLRAPPELPHSPSSPPFSAADMVGDLCETDVETKLPRAIRMRWIVGGVIVSWGLVVALISLARELLF